MKRSTIRTTPSRQKHDQTYTLASSSLNRRIAAGDHRGLTLIETALATIIVGVGVLAIVAAQQAFHQANGWSYRSAVATYLGNEIREMTLNLPRHDPVTGNAYWGNEPEETTLEDLNDLDDFDGLVFSAANETGPINARREMIPGMDGWSQHVEVNMVNANNINEVFSKPDFGATDPNEFPDEEYLIRIDVRVMYQGPYDNEPEEMTRVSWIAPK